MYAWRSATFARLGTLLVGSGLVWLVATFGLSDRAVAYSAGRPAAWIGLTGLIYLMLTFPDGRISSRLDRGLMAAVLVVLLVLWLPTALLVDRYPTPADWVTCARSCPHNAFMVIG